MIIHNEKKIINNLSVKYKLNPKVIEDVISHSLKCIKDCICMDEMPDIMIHNLGRFKASLIIMEMRFKNFIINNENNALKDFDIDVMNRLIKVYDRKVKEDKKPTTPRKPRQSNVVEEEKSEPVAKRRIKK